MFVIMWSLTVCLIVSALAAISMIPDVSCRPSPKSDKVNTEIEVCVRDPSGGNKDTCVTCAPCPSTANELLLKEKCVNAHFDCMFLCQAFGSSESSPGVYGLRYDELFPPSPCHYFKEVDHLHDTKNGPTTQSFLRSTTKTKVSTPEPVTDHHDENLPRVDSTIDYRILLPICIGISITAVIAIALFVRYWGRPTAIGTATTAERITLLEIGSRGTALDQPVSDLDIQNIVETVCSDDLRKLYLHIGLEYKDVERTKDNCASKGKNSEQQDIEVIRFWRKKCGSDASRKRILDALEEMRHLEAAEILRTMWKGRNTTDDEEQDEDPNQNIEERSAEGGPSKISVANDDEGEEKDSSENIEERSGKGDTTENSIANNAEGEEEDPKKTIKEEALEEYPIEVIIEQEPTV